MNTTLLSLFRRLFANYDWTSAQRRIYARQWVRSRRNLGARSLLAVPVTKLARP